MSHKSVNRIATLEFNLDNPDDFKDYQTVVRSYRLESSMKRILQYSAQHYSPEINREFWRILEDNLIFPEDLISLDKE